ncbi:hypothetical protein [uncultured Treponema sp.]|uniref:hypothetical protein n=1 Tax=uncultured Treponema sp. TaxID=162155 RepID=UPI0025D5FFAB|nr:hypothetical protein [uncultured Treponema sp.]
MKNSYQRIRAGFACLAGIFFAFLLASCADFSGNATGSVSFSFDKSFIKAVSNAKRAAVLDDEVTGTGSEEQYNEQFSEKYIIEVSLRGGYSDFQKKEYSMKDWFSKTEAYSSGNETESKTDEEDSTASNGFETFTFKDIPVGVKVTATVDVYMEYNYEQGSKKDHMYTGTSSPIEIKAGENPLDLNVHELKSFYIILAPEESGSLPNLKKVNLYLVKTDSKLAEELIEYAKDDDDESVIKTLEKTTPFKTYENLSSSYISDRYDLKTGDSYYLLSLAYTDDDKAYFGHPADSATGAFTVSENGNSVYVYLTLIEEDEPDEDDEFVNMTFNGAANDPAELEGTFDIEITDKGDYKIFRNYGETSEVAVTAGTYRINGDYLYYTETKYRAFDADKMTFADSWTTVSNPKESDPVLVKDGGSGKVTAFEVKICNGKVNILFQMPHEVNIKIVFKVDDNDGNPEYEYKQENITVSVTGDTDVPIEEIQKATLTIWQALATDGYTFVKEDEPVLDGSDYKIVLHFKKGTSEEVKYSIDVSTPYYNSDVDLELKSDVKDNSITFTVKSGYDSYYWIVDDANKTSAANGNSITIQAADYQPGSHSVMVVADDLYSASTTFLKK